MQRAARRDLSYWLEVVELTAIGALTRALDCLLLLARPRLVWAYLRILVAHLWASPYRWPRGFESVRARTASGVEERELVYGETPVFSAWWLLRRAGLMRGETFCDLSAGRGRPLLSARLLGAKAIGFELIAERAEPVLRPLAAVGIELRVQDGAGQTLDGIDVAMVTWTGFSEPLKARFEAAARTLPIGARFIAVDRPLEGPGFEPVDRLDVLCTWGVVPVWIYRRVDTTEASG